MKIQIFLSEEIDFLSEEIDFPLHYKYKLLEFYT